MSFLQLAITIKLMLRNSVACMQATLGVNRSFAMITTLLVSMVSFGLYEAAGNDLVRLEPFSTQFRTV
jgi:hypothetical protein